MIYISFRPLGPWRPFVRTVIFLVKLIVGWMCRWKLVCTCNSYYGPYIPLVPIDVWHLKAWTAERPERWAPEHWATNSALENILRSSLIEWMNGHLRDLLPQYYVRWIPRGLEISPELLLCYSSKLPCILDTLLQWYPIVFLGGRKARRRLWRFGCSPPDAMCGLGPWIQFYCALFDFMFSKPGPHDLPNIVSWPRRSADQWKQPSILSSGSQGCHFCTSGPPSDWRFLPRISRFGARFQCLSYGCQESATECQAGFQDKMHLMHYSRPGTT